MVALLSVLCASLLGVTPARSRPAVPAELMPRISVRAGVGGRLVSPTSGSSVRPFLSCGLEWRMGPMSKAWWRNRNPEEPNEHPPRPLVDGMEDEE
jgi:hypothetical protein